MNHKDVKKLIFNSPEVKKEYDKLDVLYDIKRQIIKLRLEQGLAKKIWLKKLEPSNLLFHDWKTMTIIQALKF